MATKTEGPRYDRQFQPGSPHSLARLIEENPLAMLLSGAGGGLRTSAVPLLARRAPDGEVVAFVGHLARTNPQLAALTADPEAVILVQGPSGYVSPSWFTDRAQGPTWVYAWARFTVRIRLFEDGEAIGAHLEELVATMEHRFGADWSVNELKHRYAGLAARIVGIEAAVMGTQARFKLAQDEREDVLGEILSALEARGRADLRRYIVRENSQRVAVSNEGE